MAHNIIQLVEFELSAAITNSEPLPNPSMGRLSRQSRTFPIQPRVHMVPDDRGRYYTTHSHSQQVTAQACLTPYLEY